MKYSGEDILRFIPQRFPFVMLDAFEDHDATHADSALTVTADNYFMLPDATMAESGLIEHVAQSCSALVGVSATGATPIGLIGEVKHFQCNRRPRCGEKINTTVSFGFSFGNVTLATGQCFVGDEQIADITLKIFVQ